jgi:hypothetical protein
MHALTDWRPSGGNKMHLTMERSPDCEAAAAALLFSNRCTCLAASRLTCACMQGLNIKLSMHLIIMVMQQSGAFSESCHVRFAFDASKMIIINLRSSHQQGLKPLRV